MIADPSKNPMASSRLRLAGRPSLCLIAGAALALCACDRMGGGKSEAAPKRAEDPSQTLAKIDDVVISVADFQTRINQQSPYVRARWPRRPSAAATRTTTRCSAP